MNKADLVDRVMEKTGATRKETEAHVNAVLGAIGDALASGNDVQLVGFGTFEVRERAERSGRNPQTGESMTIQGGKVPAFRPGAKLRQAVKA